MSVQGISTVWYCVSPMTAIAALRVGSVAPEANAVALAVIPGGKASSE